MHTQRYDGTIHPTRGILMTRPVERNIFRWHSKRAMKESLNHESWLFSAQHRDEPSCAKSAKCPSSRKAESSRSLSPANAVLLVEHMSRSLSDPGQLLRYVGLRRVESGASQRAWAAGCVKVRTRAHACCGTRMHGATRSEWSALDRKSDRPSVERTCTVVSLRHLHRAINDTDRGWEQWDWQPADITVRPDRSPSVPLEPRRIDSSRLDQLRPTPTVLDEHRPRGSQTCLSMCEINGRRMRESVSFLARLWISSITWVLFALIERDELSQSVSRASSTCWPVLTPVAFTLTGYITRACAVEERTSKFELAGARTQGHGFVSCGFKSRFGKLCILCVLTCSVSQCH